MDWQVTYKILGAETGCSRIMTANSHKEAVKTFKSFIRSRVEQSNSLEVYQAYTHGYTISKVKRVK